VDPDECTTSYHESGHVVAVLSFGWRVDSVTLDAGEFRGTVHTREREKAYRERAVVALCGPAAQFSYMPGVTDGCRIDQETAEQLAAKQHNDQAMRAVWLATVENDADVLVSFYWSRIRKLAKALLAQRTLTGQQCREIAGF